MTATNTTNPINIGIPKGSKMLSACAIPEKYPNGKIPITSASMMPKTQIKALFIASFLSLEKNYCGFAQFLNRT
jgi:hypothetical protein